MNQQMLKNIYEAFGSTRFMYKGRIMYVLQDNSTGEYELCAAQ